MKHSEQEKSFLSVKDTTIPFVEFVKSFSTEYKARRYLEKVRWNDGKVVCPFCGNAHVWKTNRDGVNG